MMKYVYVLLFIFIQSSKCFCVENKEVYVFIGSGVTFVPENIQIPSSLDDRPRYVLEAKIKNDLSMSGGFGYRFNKFFRIEGLFDYKSNKIENVKLKEINISGIGISGGYGNIRSYSLICNFWYDLHFTNKLKGYFGVGLGMSKIILDNFILERIYIPPPFDHFEKVEELEIDDESWEFAGQLGIGISYELINHVILDFGYRYFMANDPHFMNRHNEVTKMKYKMNNIICILKYCINI